MENRRKLHFNLPLLVGSFAIALLLAASWFVPGPVRNAWDTIDTSVFFTLNEMLSGWHPMAVFWAFANQRGFDLIPALVFMALFWRHISRGGPDEATLERVISVKLMVAYTLGATLVIGMLLMDIGRSGPALLLEPSSRLGALVPWLPASDATTSSFPATSGTIAIMLSICLVVCFGMRAAWWGGGLVLLVVIPRLVGGVHWLTDVAVGSLIVALPIAAILFATPCHAVLVRWIAAIVRRWLPWADLFARQICGPGTPALVGKGVCMGTADIIPGVSGGTMAYILGIYERLLGAITVFNPVWVRMLLRRDFRPALAAIPFHFLLPLGFGILLAVVIFTKMIPLPYFVQYHPEPVYGLFFGLVGGSVVLLLWQHARPRVGHAAIVAIGAAAGLAIVTLVPANTPDAPWFIFLCGMLAISAMLVPGISGSFILLILGKYALILAAIGALDLRVLAPFALGCGVGILAFAHSLKWLMKHYPLVMNLLITGLLIGTLRAVWPFQQRTYVEVSGKEKLISSDPFWPAAGDWISLATLMIPLGFAMIYALDRVSRPKNRRRPQARRPTRD